ncbi:MAG: holo-ACP synthase [Clostridium butyricum]|nr:holo-ACP synthase [Clostridium butyricum]
MIIGIGTDIIEVYRIEKAINRTNNFLEKVFTEKEIDYFKIKNLNANTIAGNFAAKEAISKALGSGFRNFGLRDIEVLRDDFGKPVVNLTKKIYDIVGRKDFKIHVSISHSRDNAIAYAVMEEK